MMILQSPNDTAGLDLRNTTIKEWRSLPPEIGNYFYCFFDCRGEHEFTNAAVFHWPSHAKAKMDSYKKYGVAANKTIAEADPERVKAILQEMSCVRL